MCAARRLGLFKLGGVQKEADELERLTGEAYGFFGQREFRSMIVRERKRTERTGKPFILLLLDLGESLEGLGSSREHISERIAIHRLVETMSEVTRDIDVRGWYERGRIVGLIFPETSCENRDALCSKVSAFVHKVLGEERGSRVAMSCYCFPFEQDGGERVGEVLRFYPEAEEGGRYSMLSLAFKRTLDLAGALLGVLLFLPVFILVPILIKLDSSGPVFFRQERVGRNGRRFLLYKFRSMHVAIDDSIHRQYVKSLIKKQIQEQGDGVYKITDDPRVTRVGRFLRKTSLDELPQFFNVLLGDMSLVGPRPAIPYETAEYEVWHRRRLLEVKPGITGIWQVEGRSRTTFDGMVRMDLRYGRRWNLLMDLKLILRTPLALIRGAY